jgi:type II secretory pathway pseudopilin PulG
METRLLVAYVLIGVLLAAALLLVRRSLIKRRRHRRVMRGLSSYKVASRR